MTDLVKRESDVPSARGRAEVPAIPEEYRGSGLEEVERGDFTMPRVQVKQPTSRIEAGQAGQFYFTLTGRVVDNINAVLLKMTKSRVYWPKGKLDADPICASDDARVPRPGMDAPAATCAECPFAQWGDDGSPPECSLTYNFLAVDIDDEDTPFIISLHGTSVKHARAVLSAFVLKRKPLWSRPVVISTVRVTNDKGTFYEVLLQPNGGGKAFDWRPYLEMYRTYQDATIKAETERPAEEAESPVSDDAAWDDVEELAF